MLLRARTTRPVAAIAALLCLPAALRAAPKSAARVAPHSASLVPGEVLRYRLQYHSSIQSNSASPVYTPEAAHQMKISLGAVLRLDVLSVKHSPRFGRLTRIRVTYQTASARVSTDAYDPGAKSLARQYRALRGRSFEFTVDGSGQVIDIAALARLEPDERAREAVREWLRELTLPLGFWRPGMKPGRKWTRVVPLTDAPLAGLAWRTRSVYRADESCPPAPGAPREIARQTCAVIETRLGTTRQKTHGGNTPLAYRRQGLRTSGRWKQSGISRSYISLATGLVTSSTAVDSSQMDLTIAATLSGSRLHYSGQMESSSQLTLIGVHLPRPAKELRKGSAPAQHRPSIRPNLHR